MLPPHKVGTEFSSPRKRDRSRAGAAYDRAVFNFGPGEVAVLMLLGILFLGPKGRPGFAARVRDVEPRPLLLRRAWRRRWTFSDWLLVCAAIALGAAVVANAIARAL
jgi:hypothetical protein